MARIVDTVIQDEVLDNATNRFYAATTSWGTRAGWRSSISATHRIFAYDIACGFTFLDGKSAPKFAGQYYVAVLHPHVAHYILTESGAGGMLAIKQYTKAGQDEIFRGEIWMLHGVRMVTSANVKTYASTVTVYPTIIMGEDAYGTTELQNMETIIHGFGSSGTEDALNQRMTVGSKVAFWVKLLQQDAVIIFESAGQATI